MAVIPHFVLNDSAKTRIPSVGLGCWMGQPGGDGAVYRMCMEALKCGYRHLDTVGANEEYVGRAMRDSGVPREDIFLTTKLGSPRYLSLSKLFPDNSDAYVDLYLMHWPLAVIDGKTLQPEESPTFVDTWKAMEKLVKAGKVKNIGVSNFSVTLLRDLLNHCEIVPAVNQVEMHPCLPQKDLKDFCDLHKIHLTAYSPLGRGLTFMENDTVKNLADKLGTTPAQVVLSWGVLRGTSVIPKSERPERILANITLIALSTEDMAVLDGLHEAPGMHRSLLVYHGSTGVVLGWTYEQFGWSMKPGGIVN
ncbi:Aldo/keto reductase [Roridomyces roridus]|uniref:Aldo/keto reductase n=1 Tax=Roridomyces roridus TaxID=1738132 RepID=A0AAD7CG54_9AGAR|nr:Aldo/keto reductase [Roridomyces roridus]